MYTIRHLDRSVTPTDAMGSSSALSSSKPTNSGEGLHPSLMGIAKAMRKAEQERKDKMDLAQEFLEIIDA